MNESELMELVCRYLTALEAGNMEEIGKILDLAESEPILEKNLDVIHVCCDCAIANKLINNYSEIALL